MAQTSRSSPAIGGAVPTQCVDGAVSVRDVSLDAGRRGQVLLRGFGTELEHAVIVVSPITRGTHLPTRYTITVEPP